MSVSSEGTLVHIGAEIGMNRTAGLIHPVLVDVVAGGNAASVTELPGLPADRYREISVSPDGSQAVTVIDEIRDNGEVATDIWILDLVRQSRRRLTNNGTSDFPTWHPQGDSVLYVRVAENDALVVRAVSGRGGERVIPGTENPVIADFTISNDGRYFSSVVAYNGMLETASSLVVGRVTGEVVLLEEDEVNPRRPAFSPNGDWVAFESSGRILVRSLEEPDGLPIIVWENDMRLPTWARDGSRLYAINSEGTPVSVEVRFDPDFSIVGPPRIELTWSARADFFDVTAVPNQFLMPYPAPDENAGSLDKDAVVDEHLVRFILGAADPDR